MKKCVWCGKEFEPKNRVQKYCNSKCSYEAQKERQNNIIYKNICTECGDTFEAKYRQAKVCKKCKRRISRETAERVNGERGSIKDRPFTATTNWQISIMDFRGQSIKEMANIFNRSIDSIKEQLAKLKRNGIYDKYVKQYIQQQPSERKLLNKGVQKSVALS
jgi:hypothetical protein